MNILLPGVAANLAALAYETENRSKLTNTAYYLAVKSLFSFEQEHLQGISGSVFERLFKHFTPFGLIGKGKPGSLLVILW